MQQQLILEKHVQDSRQHIPITVTLTVTIHRCLTATAGLTRIYMCTTSASALRVYLT